MEKYVSQQTRALAPANAIYTRLGDLRNLEPIFEQPQVQEYVSDVRVEAERIEMTIKGVGPCGLQIIEREEDRTLKFSDIERKPLPFTLWLQLHPVAEQDTRLRLTLHADIPFMLRLFLKGKVQKGLDGLAQRLADAFTQAYGANSEPSS